MFIANSYRVLLTRARQGMVIFVPQGDDRDVTWRSAFYDSIYAYLRSSGLPELASEQGPAANGLPPPSI